MNAPKVSYVSQGEFLASADPQETLSTVLGSCVAACLWDPVAQIGGMNHFLLPNAGGGNSNSSSRYGINAMEMLINQMLKLGAERRRIKAKLFGGASMSSNLGDIGGSNVRFAKTFLATEEIPCIAESLGGTSARRVTFHPVTGHARQLIVEAEDPVRFEKPVVIPQRPSFELF